MKKKYLTPDVRFAPIRFEADFLASNYNYGGTGEDFDDPDDPINPWS
jgi:hypothetical protein